MRPVFVAIVAGVLMLMSCPQAFAQNNAELAKDAEQILRKNCYRCHGQDGAAEGRLNYILDVPTLIGREKVIAGDAAKSKLYTIVEKKRMPPEDEQPQPSKADLATLKAWIDAGAPDFRPAVPKREFVTAEAMVETIFNDLRSLEEFDQKFARYFTLTHLYNSGLSDDHLQTYRIGLSRLVNSLSWGRRVAPPKAIDAAKTIFRFDLRDYRWKPETWERVVSANPFGIIYDSQTARAYYTMSGSKQPHVRGDWFVFAASMPPLYHDLLEIPKTDSQLEKMLQVDVAKNISERRTARAGFNGSGVSQNNRMIERHELDLTNGAYWKSYDFGSNSGKQNLFETPLGFEHDGGEIIFNLPNGLQAYMLVDAKGARIDRGPTSIVSDPKRPDRVVVNGLSCMSCHNQGMIEKEDQIRNHVETNKTAFGIREAELILSLYPGPKKLSSYFKEDAERFAKAVDKTGQKLDDKGKIMGTDPVVILAALFEQELDLGMAAAETGVSPEVFLRAIDRDSALSRSLGTLRNKSGTLKRDVFVGAFGDLVRDLKLGEFAAPKSGSTIVATKETSTPVKNTPNPVNVPPKRLIPLQELVVKQRSTGTVSGSDGAIRVKVDDIKRGKTADVSVVGPNGARLAGLSNAQVGDRFSFIHNGTTYFLEVVQYRGATFGSGDSAKLRIVP